MERSSVRPLLTITLLLAALLVTMNHVVRVAPLADWWLVLALLVLALLIGLSDRFTDWRGQFAALDEAPPPIPVPGAVRAVPRGAHTPGGPDDLTVVEGIGPKMAAALVAAGIDSFARLALATEQDLHAAVEAAGMRFAPSIPTWAEQASYAARGDWEGLEAFQKSLVAGRRPS